MARTANPDKELTEQEQIRKNLLVDGFYSNDNEDPTLAGTIEDAASSLADKAVILEALQESRQLASMLVNRGLGSEAQKMWVAAYLPRKKRVPGTDAAEATETE